MPVVHLATRRPDASNGSITVVTPFPLALRLSLSLGWSGDFFSSLSVGP